MKKITKIVFALMFLIVLSDQTPAQIEVSGTIINGNWLEANSPYIVVGDIFVASLTIEPGVMIKFNGPYVFEVAGTLVAAGNEQNPIIFTTNNPELFWQGIYINAAQSTLLNYCRIEWSQNYPNPFNSKTVISWQVGATGQVDLTVYNLLGQKVATLVSEMQPAGYHQLEWDAAHLPSGVYYYLIKAGEYQDVKKMILLK